MDFSDDPHEPDGEVGAAAAAPMEGVAGGGDGPVDLSRPALADAGAAVDDEEEALSLKRQRLEGELRAPDAIMEPGVLDAVAAYLEAGGQPAQVVESLSDGYIGAFGFYFGRWSFVSRLALGALMPVSSLASPHILLARLEPPTLLLWTQQKT